MRGYVANTDRDWFETLRARPEIPEINFWQPSGGTQFHAVSPGELVFFRLKSPANAIAGFGVFARHAIVPAWHAWDTFEEGNGARTRSELFERIARYRRKADRDFVHDPHGNYLIGCILLVEPVFFGPDEFVHEPRDWAKNIVRGKTYDLTSGEGLRILGECLERLSPKPESAIGELDDAFRRFGAPQLITPRLGQGTFRIAVEAAYNRACAVTGEHSLPVLEAAHIKPYSGGGLHSTPNGLLLRRDIHRLFDLGYVTVTPDSRFRVSGALRRDFDNGRTYYAFDGEAVGTPKSMEDRPSAEHLQWHNEVVFRG